MGSVSIDIPKFRFVFETCFAITPRSAAILHWHWVITERVS